jgi:hypothetical protein
VKKRKGSLENSKIIFAMTAFFTTIRIMAVFLDSFLRVVVLVNLGCYNKMPYTEWLKQQNVFPHSL